MENHLAEWVMRSVLSPDSCCLDVGSHIGSVLSLFCRVAPQGRHLGIEPTPFKAQWLRRKFPEVDIHEVALGARSDRVTFHEHTAQPGRSSLGAGSVAGDDRLKYTVTMSTLDTVAATMNRIDLIKIDVEGAELGVLQGGAETILRFRPHIVLECGPGGPERFGHTRGEVMGHLSDTLRYDLYRFRDFLDDGQPLDIGAIDWDTPLGMPAYNFIASPKPKSRASPS